MANPKSKATKIHLAAENSDVLTLDSQSVTDVSGSASIQSSSRPSTDSTRSHVSPLQHAGNVVNGNDFQTYTLHDKLSNVRDEDNRAKSQNTLADDVDGPTKIHEDSLEQFEGPKIWKLPKTWKIPTRVKTLKAEHFSGKVLSAENTWHTQSGSPSLRSVSTPDTGQQTAGHSSCANVNISIESRNGNYSEKDDRSLLNQRFDLVQSENKSTYVDASPKGLQKCSPSIHNVLRNRYTPAKLARSGGNGGENVMVKAPGTNNIFSEITFVKDEPDISLRRVLSPDSMTNRSGKQMVKPMNESWNSYEQQSVTVNDRFMEINQANVKRELGKEEQLSKVQDSSFHIRLAEMAKRRERNKHRSELVKDNVADRVEERNTSEGNNVKYNNQKQITTQNEYSASGMKQAKCITEDLKLVKAKLKRKDMIINDLSKSDVQAKQRRNILLVVNRNKGRSKYNASRIPVPERRSSYRTTDDDRDDTSTAVTSSDLNAIPQIYIGNRRVNEHDHANTHLATAKIPRPPNKFKLKHRNNVQVFDKNRYVDNDVGVMYIQPKIHRINQARNEVKAHKLRVRDKRNNRLETVTNSSTTNANRERNVVNSEYRAVIHQRVKKASVRNWVMASTRTATKSKENYAINVEENREFIKVNQSKWRRPPVIKVRYPNRKLKIKSHIMEGKYLSIERASAGRMRAKRNLRRKTALGEAKGYESEIQILYDDDDVYLEPRPYTDTERNRYPHHRRYEGENDNTRINYRDPAHKRVARSTGALVTFLRNGDRDYKGMPFNVNDCYRNFESLLVALNEKITTTTGVKYIFKLPEFTEITSVTQFKNRCVYVVSSTKAIRRDVIYGDSRENHWSNKKPSAGKLRKNEVELYKKPRSPVQMSPQYSAPLIVTIINNLSRDKREKVILNPQTQQAFEEWLQDIDSNDLPVKALFSEKPPYSEVNSFSHLFREMKTQNNFIACGEEMLPLEITKKRQAPSSNSSSDSVSDRGKKKKPPRSRDMGQIYELGRPDSPTSTAMSRYDLGPRTYGVRGRPLDSNKNTKDNVEIEIDGIVREFIPPSYVDPADDGAKPEKQLRCEWVYGFRGRDSRHNLKVLPKTGELVYYVASIVVLYDKERDTQRHYSKHNEEITCMTIHPNEYLVASGQLQGKDPEHASHIRIWHGVTLSTYSVIGVGVFDRSIISIGFSYDGKGNYMCALDGSAKHVLSVWEWQTEKIMARSTTSTDTVHAACFYPDGTNNSILITYGAKHIYFWKIFYDAARKREAKILRDRNSGIFEDGNFADHLIEDIPKCINCVEFLPTGDVVTGDTSGNIMVWDRDPADAFTCKLVVQGHKGPVSAMCLLEDGTLLSASAAEVKAWDSNSNFRSVKSRQGMDGRPNILRRAHEIPTEAGNIRAIVCQTPGGIDGKLFIGTTKSCILDGSLQQRFRYMVQGHSDDVYGVMPHPFEPTFISAGMDQVVFKWSLLTHKVIWRSQVESPCTSVAVNHRHELIAIGTSDGSLVVLNAYNGMHIASVDVGGGSISCIAFSPDGTLLTVGSNNSQISVYAIHDRGQTFRKFKLSLKGHNGAVVHMDWSSDGRSLQSVSDDHELLFWDVDSMQPIQVARMMRDVDWFTNMCHVSYPLIGPWSNMEKNELITVVSRSNYRDLLIAGDTRGRLRLYKYPCSKEKAEFRNIRVHSSEVTAAAFTPDNRCALTCGGNDATLIQWTLVEEQ